MSSPRQFQRLERGGHPATYEEIFQAQNEGARAVLNNQGLSTCPYKNDRSERGQYLGLMWQRAWRGKKQQILNGDETAER